LWLSLYKGKFARGVEIKKLQRAEFIRSLYKNEKRVPMRP